MQKGGRAETDALSRMLISHAKSPGTGPWTLDVPLTLNGKTGKHLVACKQKNRNQQINGLSALLGEGKGDVGGASECWAGFDLEMGMRGMDGD